uniref:Uncharacterized protein n=1 Tax=Arundo donax TaxID=35708 RepID=A0A0A9B6Q8_ARUDO
MPSRIYMPWTFLTLCWFLLNLMYV